MKYVVNISGLCVMCLVCVVSVAAQTGVVGAEAWTSAGSDEGGGRQPVAADPETAPVYYALHRSVAYASPDSANPYLEIDAREPVRLLRVTGSWAEVKLKDGAQGYVRTEALSNLWIRVSKGKQTVWIYRGPDLEATIPADMAYNFFLDKQRRGSREQPDHWRTPEGLYHVVAKNPQSLFYKAFVLNYPSAADGERGFSEGLISDRQLAAIRLADQRFAVPPMDTPLGGWIEIHGQGSGARTTWTRGCVAIPNADIDALWESVHVGTPVLIEP